MKDFIAINGHQAFKPELYGQVAGAVRNYHNMAWDFLEPGDDLNIPMSTHGINWDTDIYRPWKEHGFDILLCTQFANFGGKSNENYKELWQGQEEWFGNFGKEMAAYYGSRGKQLITAIEVGNEPGVEFDDAVFVPLFKHIAAGIREGDPQMKILTCAVWAREADKWEKDIRETFGSDDIKPLYDAISTHTYPLLPRGTGPNPWSRSYPEDPGIEYLTVVQELIDWRDASAPGKPIWITEFGYDAPSEEAMKNREGNFKKLDWDGVNELEQAQYLVRSLMLFAEMDVERAFIYYYNDKDRASTHGSSGLTRNFEPKKAFWAVRHCYQSLGDYRFSRVVQKQPGDLYIYEFVHGSDASRKVWVVWKPTGDGQSQTLELADLPGEPIGAERMPIADGPAGRVPFDVSDDGGITVEVTESPLYLFF